MSMDQMSKCIFIFLCAFFFSFLINQFGIALSVVSGTSMSPTLHNGDWLLINKFTFLVHPPVRGDVITFQDPSSGIERYLVKRVIGIPGDKLQIRAGKLYRNDEQVTEWYTDTSIEDGDYGPIFVASRTVFVMGDNRHCCASRDSRYENVGLVPVDRLDGRVEWIVWSPLLRGYFMRKSWLFR